MRFRFAACNEVFGNQPMVDVLTQLREAGYQGIEIAPFTLASDPTCVSAEDRLYLRRQISDSGLSFVGLHWLLMAPEGLHATSKDKELRTRTWTYVNHFIDLCADLGDNGVVVFGSPKQRTSRDGMSSREATDIFIEGFAAAAPHAEERGVTFLIEPLSPDQTDVVTSLAEAVDIVRQIDSPAIQTMFDVHNAIKETSPPPDLIRQYFPYIKHVHVNELDGREPGMGDYDFASLLKCLSDLDYQGWVSLEAFDFTRDPKEIVTRSINHLKASQS